MAESTTRHKLVKFLTWMPANTDSMPLIEKVKLAVFYALVLAGFVGGAFNLYMTCRPETTAAFVALLIFEVFLTVALITFLQSRQLKRARTFMALAILVLMSHTIIEAGGTHGFGIFYFLAGLPLLYFILSLPAGTFMAVLLFAGTAVRLSIGHFTPESIYNNPDHVSRTLLIMGVGSCMGMVVNFCLFYFVRQLSSLAYNDQVTALPNRHRLQNFLTDVVVNGVKDGSEFSLLGIRIINYDKVNTNLGSSRADKVLRELAERLETVLSDSRITGRWSGSMFISITDQTAPDILGSLGKEIHAALSSPLEAGSKKVYVQATCAVCRYPVDGVNPEELIRNLASLLDTHQGMDGRMVFYNESIHRREEFRSKILEALIHTDMDKEFSVVFQPKVRFADLSCCGAEVLCRWEHPKLGMVNPADFIPLAEESGIIRNITRQVISLAFAYLDSPAARDTTGMENLVHAINLSVMDLKDRGFLGFLRETLQKYRIAPKTIEFELTEGILVDEDYQIQHTLKALMDLGFHVAIDDFGTGYSSLSYLHKMNVQNLKIDQSFVSIIDPEGSPDATWPVVDAIISMGQSLGLEITAEGVESQAQAEYLRQRGCTTAQGWLYSKGISFAEYQEFIRKSKA